MRKYKNNKNRTEILNFNDTMIDTHFLFNSLETINCLALSLGAIEICKITLALAKIIRYVMTDKQESTKLEDEISFINEYLTIQSIRYNEVLTFEINSDPSINKRMCPKFLIQTIVDRIIYYYIERNDMDCHIEVTGEEVGEFVVVTIQNDVKEICYSQLSSEDLSRFKKHLLSINETSKNDIKSKYPNAVDENRYDIRIVDCDKKRIIIKIEIAVSN